MTAPTVPVTINLADLGGPAISGVTVTAKMSDWDISTGDVFVSAKPVTGVTDVTGTVVLELFPNAMAPDGLGTRGTLMRVTARPSGGKKIDVNAYIPNVACNLADVVEIDESVGLSTAQIALAQVQLARAVAVASAAQAAHIYGGLYADDPLTRPDGTAIQNGDQYFNSTAGLEKRFNGATWQASDINTANLAAGSGASLVGFTGLGTGAVALTLQDWLRGYVTPEGYGAVGDGEADDKEALDACFAAASTHGRKVRCRRGARYYIGACNTVQTRDDLHVDFGGATLVADASTTTPNAVVDSAFTYQNWLIYTPTGQVRHNVVFENLNIEVTGNVKVSGVQIGESGGAENGYVCLNRFYMTGGNTGAQIRKAALYVGNFRTYATGGHGLFCRDSTVLYLEGVDVRFAGVTTDYATWTNVAAVQGWGSKKVTANNIFVHATGGTSVTFAALNSEVESIAVSNVVIEGSGQSGLSVSGRITSTTERVHHVTLSNIIVRGWMCSPDGVDHQGIILGSQGANTQENVTLNGALLDFCAPWESFDVTNARVQGTPTDPVAVPINPRKGVNGTDMGAAAGVQFLVPASGVAARNVVVQNVQLLHVARTGINLQKVSGAKCSGVLAKHCGWDRTGANAAWGIQSVVCADDSINVSVSDVSVIEHGLGVTSSDFLVPVRANRAIAFTLDNLTGKNTATNVPFSLLAQGDSGGGATVTVDGYTEAPSYKIGRISTENMETTTSGVRQMVKLQFTVKADVRNDHVVTCIGARTITQEPSFVQVNSAPATVQTMPAAANSTDKVIRFYNKGAGAATLTPSAGTIDGAATFALTTGLSAVFAAVGTDWIRVG